ncbi:MAG: biotin synthase BioB [Rhodospirillaceae bacterium]|jgi:biotin synthase|nr:biotin synthase BioB [Rhodospirillaceae bacterium]MBT3885188.1 biotin synthase BioB [Rhodospirillaceae bacterium]MBT4119212.1 biotin synthase BioB [Rhodospirillaceae bacterium]MBT4672749.1 biotin synthase BioB [Rhodospirillaceae bacterium]MBT4718696.1 biotin synthase BioB [Rhodospirillaceae bacterium]
MNLQTVASSGSGETTSLPSAWTQESALSLFESPLNDLLFQAQTVHRRHFDANKIQASALLNVKTGGCSEDCAYCSQSIHHGVELERESLLDIAEVTKAARQAKDEGATRFCMGAAWRSPNASQMDLIAAMIGAVKEEGMEACVTLGMLNDGQAERLKEAGLDYYNHNIDTSEDFYGKIISTRSFDDRLDTLARVREAGINVCAGGIIGMGEARADRVGMLLTLASLPEPPESVPINLLIPIAGTPLENAAPPDIFEIVRTIAAARIMMPASYVRLSAGRESMSDELHALCFMAGANSMFIGDKLLTAANPAGAHDRDLLERLGLSLEADEGE